MALSRTLRLTIAALLACAGLGASPALADFGRAFCSRAQVEAHLKNPEIIGQKKVVAEKFYEEIKKRFKIYNEPSATRYAGTDAIINYWNERYAFADPDWLAYILATAYHETGTRMAPVREAHAPDDDRAIRWVRAYGRKIGSRAIEKYTRVDDRTGFAYFGRGYVQLTWAANYQKADWWLQIDPKFDGSLDEYKKYVVGLSKEQGLEAGSYYWNANLALEPDSSVKILFSGMSYGWYSSPHCMHRYFKGPGKPDFIKARQIVNRMDKAGTIAAHAEKFYAALLEPGVLVDAEGFVDVAKLEQEKKEEQKKEDEKRNDELVRIAAADLDKRFAAAASEVKVLREALAEQSKTFAAQMVSLSNRLDEREEEAQRQKAILYQQETRIGEQTETISLLLEDLESARLQRERVALDLARAREALEAEIKRAESREKALESQLAAVQERISALGLRIDGLAEDVRIAQERTLWDFLFGGSRKPDGG